jgi:hypothetical protein
LALFSVLKSFYASAPWQNFRLTIIAERGLICEYCRKIISDPKNVTIHHTPIELTPENVHNVTISLNPANVKLICHDCHDKAHSRFGYQKPKGVFVVYGPPLAGKKTYVRQSINRGDIVICMDSLYEAITWLPEYDKPDVLLGNIKGVYNYLTDTVKTRYGKWGNAWVITGGADKYKREHLAEEVGGELVYCECGKEICISRLMQDESRRFRVDEWRGYINKWFEEYTK